MVSKSLQGGALGLSGDSGADWTPEGHDLHQLFVTIHRPDEHSNCAKQQLQHPSTARRCSRKCCSVSVGARIKSISRMTIWTMNESARPLTTRPPVQTTTMNPFATPFSAWSKKIWSILQADTALIRHCPCSLPASRVSCGAVFNGAPDIEAELNRKPSVRDTLIDQVTID